MLNPTPEATNTTATVDLKSASSKTIELENGTVAILLSMAVNPDDETRFMLDTKMVHFYNGDITKSDLQKQLHVIGKGTIGAIKYHTDSIIGIGMEIYMQMQPDAAGKDGEVDLVAMETVGNA